MNNVPNSSENGPVKFVNSRGEAIDATHVLISDVEYGAVWKGYIEAHMPRELFKEVGLIDTLGSEEWFNVVEHSALVAAFARMIAQELQTSGVDVSVTEVERAAWVHDATKRRDVTESIRREQEPSDDLLPRLLKENGYSDVEIAAAKNTGRVADRSLTDADERQTAIRHHTVEENIVGYADARVRGAKLMNTLDAAKIDSIQAKPGETDFFNNSWYPYYKDVEAYLSSMADGYSAETVSIKAVAENLAHST
ncbi:MAG: HD domain-containing protein [Candidatus Saccharimonadales bacterium]